MTGGASPGRRRSAGLRRLLLSIAVVSGAVYLAFWTAWTWNRVGDERDRAEAGLERTAKRAAEAFAGFLSEQAAAVAEVAASLDPAALASPACQVAIPSTMGATHDGRPLGRYDLVRPDGTVVCTTAGTTDGARPGHDDRGAPWLEPGYRSGSRTGSYRDPATGRPVWAGAEAVGVGPERVLLVGVIEFEPASSQLGQLFGGDDGTEFMVWDAATGAVLSRPEGSSWAPGRPGSRIAATAGIPTTDWRLATGLHRSTAYAEAWSEGRGGALALLAAMAALGLTTALVHRRIVQPLTAITSAARRAADGGATELEEDGPAELAELAAAMNELTASRARQEELLKLSAEQMAHSLDRLDAVLANSADMVLIVDASGLVTYASPVVAAVCGPTAGAGAEFTSLVHPDDAGAASALVRPGTTTGDTTVLLRMGRGPDAWRHVEVVARDLLAHRAVRGVVLNGRDVTERLAEAAERAELDEQLHQSQRLESLGALAGGIAHDFKNLLSVIVGTADMMVAHPPPNVEDLEEIRAAGMRGVELAQQLLTFSRRDDVTPEPVDVGVQVLALGEMLRRTLGDEVDLELQVAPALPAVRLNRSRLDQAVVNLAVNARDAMGARGRLVVEVRAEVVVAEPGVPAGPYVVVSVSDGGAGMTPEVAARAMEPFFTTKGPGQGTGLGLAIVHGIVTGAGGAVRIHSTPGEGTTVRLFLPASTEPTSLDGGISHLPPVLGAGEVVLVVEDHAALRSLVERMLEAGNYVPVGARDADHALAILGDPGRPIDLVLTDLLMPGISGRELAARIRELRPELPVVYMSAYTADVLERLQETEPGAAPVVLEKPFSQRQLLDALHGALSGARSSAGR